MSKTKWIGMVYVLARGEVAAVQVYRDLNATVSRPTDRVARASLASPDIGSQVLALLKESVALSAISLGDVDDDKSTYALMKALGETSAQTFRKKYHQVFVSLADSGQVRVVVDIRSPQGRFVKQEWKMLDAPVKADEVRDALAEMIQAAESAITPPPQ